jgi:hypothetical protein
MLLATSGATPRAPNSAMSAFAKLLLKGAGAPSTHRGCWAGPPVPISPMIDLDRDHREHGAMAAARANECSAADALFADGAAAATHRPMSASGSPCRGWSGASCSCSGGPAGGANHVCRFYRPLRRRVESDGCYIWLADLHDVHAGPLVPGCRQLQNPLHAPPRVQEQERKYPARTGTPSFTPAPECRLSVRDVRSWWSEVWSCGRSFLFLSYGRSGDFAPSRP